MRLTKTKLFLVPWIIAGLSLVGCSTRLYVDKVGVEPPPRGQVYCLPKSELEVTHSQVLTECKTDIRELLLRSWAERQRQQFERVLRDVVDDLLPTIVLASSFCVTFEDAFGASLPRGATCATSLAQEIERLKRGHGSDTLVAISERALERHWEEFLSRGLAAYRQQWLDAPLPTAFSMDQLDSLRARWSLKVNQTAAVRSQMLPDPDHAYAIDYLKMSSGFKKTKYVVDNYPNGTLKNVNVTIDDQTAEVVGSALRGVLQLASLTSGFSVDFAAATAAGAAAPQAGGSGLVPFDEFLRDLDDSALKDEAAAHELCTQAVVRSLERKKENSKKLEKALLELRKKEQIIRDKSPQLTKKKRDLATAQASLKGAEKTLAKMIKDGVPASDLDRKKLEAKIKELKTKTVPGLTREVSALDASIKTAQRAKLEIEKKNAVDLATLRQLDSVLTAEVTFPFSPDRKDFQTMIPIPDKVFGWFQPANLQRFCEAESDGPVECVEESSRRIPKELLAFVAAVPPASAPSSTFNGIDKEKNLVYRQPASVPVMVCRIEACIREKQDKPRTFAPRADRLVDQITAVPQFGVLATLPLTNGSFQNNSLVAKFSEAGTLTHVTYESNARLAKAAKLFEESIDTLKLQAEARRGSEKEKIERETAQLQAEMARLAAELDLAKAQQDLDDFLIGVAATTSRDTEEDTEAAEDSSPTDESEETDSDVADVDGGET